MTNEWKSVVVIASWLFLHVGLGIVGGEVAVGWGFIGTSLIAILIMGILWLDEMPSGSEPKADAAKDGGK